MGRFVRIWHFSRSSRHIAAGAVGTEKRCLRFSVPLALGIGSGFRPDLIAFLFPLWAVSTWVGTKSWRSVFQASVLLGAIVLVWVGALIFAMGGFQTFYENHV
jgi:hypothetical protein